MNLKSITRESVLLAIAEFDRLGRDEFLAKYKFQRSKSYVLVHEGKEYDSKAILGVAFGHANGCEAAKAKEFSGGAQHAAGHLASIGFTLTYQGQTFTPPPKMREGK